MIRTVPASDIEQRGIDVLDEMICDGPVHVIKDDRPRYVVMSEEHFAELVEAQHEAYVARVRASLEDVAAGRVTRGTADDLIRMLDTDDECMS